MKRLLPPVVAFAALYGCVKKVAPPDALSGSEYYPVQTGRYTVYEVDSTVYGDIPRDTVTTRYRVKEKLADAFADNEGKEAYRLERYYKMFDPARPYDSMPWKMKEVWMVNASREKLQVMEGNVRYTKLVFPAVERTSWNGNAYNSGGSWTYTYDYVGKTESFGSKSFDQVLKVEQKEQRTLISFEEYYEKYAAGVGLAERVMTALYSNSIVPGQPVEKRIENGFTYRQTLIDHGHE